MDNQHRLIKGYRDLTEEEIALMNRVKEFGVIAQQVQREVADHVRKQMDAASAANGDPDLRKRLNEAEPARWAAIGRTHLQEGLMALTRAIAQPGFF